MPTRRYIYTFITILTTLLTGCKRDSSFVHYSTPILSDSPAVTIVTESHSSEDPANQIIISSDSGVYIYNTITKTLTKTSDISVSRIVPVSDGLMLLTDKGIVHTPDGRTFSDRSNGIHNIELKVKTDTGWTYMPICTNLTDLEVCPTCDDILITADKTGVYITQDRGNQWQFIGSPSVVTGLKSAAVLQESGTLRLFVSHAYKGIFTRLLTDKHWTNISSGLIQFGKQYDEIGDIRTIVHDGTTDIYASTNFTPAIHRLNGDHWDMIWQPTDAAEFDIIEDMQTDNRIITFSSTHGRMEINISGESSAISNKNSSPDEKVAQLCHELHTSGLTNIRSVTFCEADDPHHRRTYNGLNLCNPGEPSRYPQACNKKGIYLESDILRDEDKLSEYITLMKNIGLNAIVFDVKDDDGNLRFKPNSETLKSMSSAEEPIHLDRLIQTARDNNLYLIGRLVLFKDKHLYEYDDQRYAVKDRLKMKDASADTTGWHGYYMTKNRRKQPGDDQPEEIKRYYKEYWCDPYSTDVWEYNCAIAAEIVSRGIDEIQFDYIRFPTDGDNLRNAVFTYRDDKHDSREGAILSFLHYIRQNINAPLSIDVYGANGWYRTGGSTGQDVMTLSRYVDVICPMYYPSHFDDDFQSQPPEEDRPYRIYYYGSLRAKHIADYRAIIRPYIQAFKLYTDYDKKYFGQHYITTQIKGVENSINEGWTFWDMLDEYKYVKFLAEKK